MAEDLLDGGSEEQQGPEADEPGLRAGRGVRARGPRRAGGAHCPRLGMATVVLCGRSAGHGPPGSKAVPGGCLPALSLPPPGPGGLDAPALLCVRATRPPLGGGCTHPPRGCALHVWELGPSKPECPRPTWSPSFSRSPCLRGRPASQEPPCTPRQAVAPVLCGLAGLVSMWGRRGAPRVGAALGISSREVTRV